MKGISPMIATVLLIALVVAIGGILSVWLSGYFTSITQPTGASTTTIIKCSYSFLEIKEVKYYTNRVSALIVYQYGTESLRNVSCTALGQGYSNTSAVSYTTTDFSPGDSFYCNIDTTGGPITPTTIRAKGYCLGQGLVTAETSTVISGYYYYGIYY